MKDENKWQEDMITLQNYIDYGETFIKIYNNQS